MTEKEYKNPLNLYKYSIIIVQIETTQRLS